MKCIVEWADRGKGTGWASIPQPLTVKCSTGTHVWGGEGEREEGGPNHRPVFNVLGASNVWDPYLFTLEGGSAVMAEKKTKLGDIYWQRLDVFTWSHVVT
jgi:hypothetical protein